MTSKVKDDDTMNGNYILQLNKNTGEIEQKIKLLDKTPDYILDEVDSRVFLNEKNKLISSYQL